MFILQDNTQHYLGDPVCYEFIFMRRYICVGYERLLLCNISFCRHVIPATEGIEPDIF
jgi:hypothetical protein